MRDTFGGNCANFLTLPVGVDIALAPSGTDVELLTLALAAGGSNRPIVNIIVGPSEVGSGTSLAAACRHYDCLTPNGRQVLIGEPVDQKLASLTDVRKSGDTNERRGNVGRVRN